MALTELGELYKKIQQGIKDENESDFRKLIDEMIKQKQDRQCDKRYLALSYFELGQYYSEKGQEKEAKELYKSINFQDDNYTYMSGQFALLNLELANKNYEAAEVHLNDLCVHEKFIHNDSSSYYETGLVNFGLSFKKNGEMEKAKEKFEAIQNNKEIKAYGIYQIALMMSDVTEKYNYLRYNLDLNTIVGMARKYKFKILEKIIELNIDHSRKEIFDQLSDLIDNTLNSLFVNSRYDVYVAHYTSIGVAKTLLVCKTDKEKLIFDGHIRLNSTTNVNDPTEGKLLDTLFDLKAASDETDQSYIACFTLHHDSLNQFRLYGKEKLQEASGLSLIFDRRKFFFPFPQHDRISNSDGLEHDYFNNELMPLYRCIYLDPTSGLIKVAQREEWSFHREYKEENKKHIFDQNTKAEKYWKEYQDEILKIESVVSQNLKELSETIKKINQEALNKDEKKLFAEILLPLRYLIKHMAFKEEQECRMIYVTQMDNPRIKYDEKINSVYIDYEPLVMQHLKRIFLAPKAKDEKILFEYLCSRGQDVREGKPTVKVKISQNPFR